MAQILEQEALAMVRAFDGLNPEEQAEATAFIERYRHQQEHDLGEPLFPTLARQQAEETTRFRGMFEDIKKVDEASPAMAAIAPHLQDADAARARTANVLFLSKRYGKREDEVNRSYDLYRRDYANQTWDEVDLDDGAFYLRAADEVKEEKAREDAIREASKAARKAALQGSGIRLQSLREWQSQAQAKGGYSAEAMQEFSREYDELRDAVRPHRALIDSALHAMQRSAKGEGSKDDAQALNRLAWALTEMPAKERRAVALAIMGEEGAKGAAEKLGEGAGRGVADTFTGSVSRLFDDMFGDESMTGRQAELFLSRLDATKPQPVSGYLSGPEEARAFVADAIQRDWLARLPGGLESMPAPAHPRKLDANEQKLVEQARQDMERRVRVGRDLKLAARATDPFDESVFGKMASGTGSTAALGLTLMLGTPGMMMAAAGYQNLDYAELRRKYPDITPEQADEITLVSASAQALLDKVGAKGLAMAPSLTKSITGQATKELAKRAGMQAGKVFALENAVEFVQDYSTPAVQHIAGAMGRDVPQVDWQMEMKHFWRSRADVALGMIPLTLLGVGAASVKDFATARDMMSRNEELGQAGIVEADRVQIIEHAANGRTDEAQAALQDAWQRRSPEVAAEFQNEAEGQRIEVERALDDAVRRGIMPRVQRTDAGYTITDNEGTSVTVETREEAVQLAAQHLSDNERDRLDAITEAFDAVAQKGDVLDLDVTRERTLKAGKADVLGKWTEDEAAQAAVTQGVLDGMSEADARETTFAVLGSNTVERAERVRDGVTAVVNVARSELNAGSNVLTALEEPVHGNWTRGLREGRWTQNEGLSWVRLAERVTGQTFLSAEDAAVLAQPESRALNEALAALVIADTVGRRKDGSRVLSGAVSRGLLAEMRNAKEADRGAAGKLRAFLRAWREYFAQVFSRARALAKARKEGKLGGGFDEFMDGLLGSDPQARHERGAAREAESMEWDEGTAYTPPTAEQEAAGIMFSLSRNAFMEMDGRTKAVRNADAAKIRAIDGDALMLGIPSGYAHRWGVDKLERYARLVETGWIMNRHLTRGFSVDYLPIYEPHFEDHREAYFEALTRVRDAVRKITGDNAAKYDYAPTEDERTSRQLPGETGEGGKREAEAAAGGLQGEQDGQGAVQGDAQGGVAQGTSDKSDFSLAPRQLLDRIGASLAARIKSPEQREAFFKLAKQRLQSLREDSLTWRHDVREGLDSMADRDRTAESLNTERKFRFRSRQRELIEAGMAGLSRETLDAFHSDSALGDARHDPLIAEMLVRDAKAIGGWRGRLRSFSAADEKTQNEYDDMPEGLPRWMFGGTMAPDQLAQELYDNGQIVAPSPTAMWQAVERAFKTAEGLKENFKQARESVAKVEHDAKVQARNEADAWHEKAKVNVPTAHDKMMAALRVMDAILSAFPAEVRGKLGGMTKLAGLKSDKARLKHMLGRLEALDNVLEKHLRDHFSEAFTKLMERAQPKGKPGEGVKGKLGAPAHAWFEQVEKAAAMTRQQADERMTEIEGLLATDLTPEREAELVEEYLAVQEFGAFATRSSAEMETALHDAQAVFEKGRDSWQAVLEERAKLHANIIKQGIREIGNKGKLSDQSKGGEARSKNPLAWAADKFVRQIWTWMQTLQATFNRNSAVAVRFAKLARTATRTERDAVLKREADFAEAMKSEVLPGTDRRARNRWLHDLLQPSRTISILEDVKTEKMKVPVSIARAVVASGNTLKGHDFTDADAAELEALLIENDALPEKKRKDMLPFERAVFGGVRRNITLSEAEAIHLLMTWTQQEYRSGLELHGFDGAAMEDLRDAVTPAGYRLMGWLARQYQEGYAPLNAVHARVRGVNLPRVEHYAPGHFEHEGNVSEMALDSPHLQNGNLRNGFTKKRKNHVARVRLDFEHHSINAVSIYWNHVAQAEHWKAWVEPTGEMKAVLRNRDIRAAVVAAHGQEAVNSLNGWLELFENGGLRNGWENMQQARWVNRIMRAKARVSLMLRLPVYLVQSTASVTSLLDLPAKQGLKSFARVLSGQGRMSVADAFKHPVIQRRMKGGFSPEARIAKAAKSGSGGKLDKASAKALAAVGLHPTDLEAGMEWGMETIGKTDAFFTSVSAATAYDAHYAQAEALGMNATMAEAYALEKMEETVQRTAQPVELADRSLAESTPNVFLRLLMMFTSEPRQKVALEFAAARHLWKGEAKPSELARMVFLNHVVLGSMVWMVRSIARDLLNDDDDNGMDDPAWEAEDWLMSVLLGPFSGLPLLGDVAEWLSATVAGRRPFEADAGAALGPVKDVGMGIKGLLTPPGDEEIEHYAKHLGRIVRGVAIGVGGNAAALGVVENVVEQVFQLGDNLIDE